MSLIPPRSASATPTPGASLDTGDRRAPSRRQVLCGLAVALLAPGALAACANGDDGPGRADNGTDDGTSPADSPAPTEPGDALASVSDVPVGGGILVNGPDGQLLLVQPTEGDIKAYDPSCTHMGTSVNPPQDGVMTCPNHGSQFHAADGGVAKGPAERPLAEVPVTVEDGSILLA